MAHFHRCRFDMQPEDKVRVDAEKVTIEAQQSWIDLGCIDAGKAREVAAAFHELADRLDAQMDAFMAAVSDEAVEECIRCGATGRLLLLVDEDRLCTDCAHAEAIRREVEGGYAEALRDAAAGEVVT